VLSRPVSVLAMIGKTHTIAAEAMTALMELPNQITSMGAMATMGTVWKKTA
jgi:hypothetical protein